MPKSKHRHKGSGKSISRPGDRPSKLPWHMVLWGNFAEIYKRPFFRMYGHEIDAGDMLDIIEIELFDTRKRSFITLLKEDVIYSFLDRTPDSEDTVTSFTLDQAEAALNFLVQAEMIVITEDVIAHHPRFNEEFTKMIQISHENNSKIE